MNLIRIVLGYSDLFDDEPKTIAYYLSGIPKDILLFKALYYCSLSTLLDPKLENLFFPFLEQRDIGSKFDIKLRKKIAKYIIESNEIPIILNVRSSLKFFESIQGIDSYANKNYSDETIKKRLLKAYLLFNSQKIIEITGGDRFNENLISISLIQSIYSETNCNFLRIAELVKSCLFLEYCSIQIPRHLNDFLTFFGIDTWQEYVLYIHQIGMLLLRRDLSNPVISISIPPKDENYNKKLNFLNKFLLSDISTVRLLNS